MSSRKKARTGAYTQSTLGAFFGSSTQPHPQRPQANAAGTSSDPIYIDPQPSSGAPAPARDADTGQPPRQPPERKVVMSIKVDASTGKVNVKLRPLHTPNQDHHKRVRAALEDERKFGGRGGTAWFTSADGKARHRELWLKFDASTRLMSCSACIRFNPGTNNLKSGTPSIRLETVTRHEDDKGHREAVDIMLNQDKMVADWNQAVNNQIISAQEDIINTIAAVYWLCKEQIAVRKTPSLLRLLEDRGVTISKFYANKYAAAQFARCLAQVIRKWRLNAMRSAGYYGLMIDEGTDIGYESVLIAYVKWVNPADGKVCCCHLVRQRMRPPLRVHVRSFACPSTHHKCHTLPSGLVVRR